MLYSKGDTLELAGKIALVLNDGIKGKEFYLKHGQERFREIFYNRSCHITFYTNDNRLKHYVWYNVLVGDMKGWYAVHYRFEDLEGWLVSDENDDVQ